MSDNVLELKGFGLAFKDRIILSSITLDVPDTGVMTLMGPCGTGKSSLIRTLAGFCQANPAHRIWGEAIYAGNELFGSMTYPAIVSQNTRLMISSVLENIVFGLPERNSLTIPQQQELARRLLEFANLKHLFKELSTPVTELDLADQRQLSILRQAASNPKLLCIDEPDSNLDKSSTERMIDYIKREAERRAVLIVTHDKQLTRALGGNTALIAGGWVQEVQKTEDFFSNPVSDAAKTFVQTGSCSVPSPDAKPEHVAPEFVPFIRKPPKEATQYKSHVLGPNGFMWLKKGKLAGTPRPGLLVDKERDLKALKRVGVTYLISLTQKPLDEKKCLNFGIKIIRSPILDMHAPELEQAMDICQQITELLESNEVVAVHCRAGLGRTGTLLAAQLIYEGQSALEALEISRGIESRWIQSDVQLEFLENFERYLRGLNMMGSKAENTVDAGVMVK